MTLLPVTNRWRLSDITATPAVGARLLGAIVAGALATGVLLAYVTTAEGVGLWVEPQWEPTPVERDPRPVDLPVLEGELEPLPAQEQTEPAQLPGWLEAIIKVLTVAAIFWGGAALTRTVWRSRPRLRFRRAARNDDILIVPDVAAAVVEEAAAQRSALGRGNVRNAIVACWLQLEHDVERVGLQRHPADTSAEFTERILGNYSVDNRAIHDLAALYREARFSDHPMGETERAAALDALDRLHIALGDQVSV